MSESLSRRRDGLVTAAELKSRGLTSERIRRLVAARALTRVRYGVYHDPAIDWTATTGLAARIVYLDQRRPPGQQPAALTGTHGLRHQGLDLPMAPSAVPTILVDARNRAQPRPTDFRTLRSAYREPHTHVIDGVRTASPGRCLIDAASCENVTDAELRACVDGLRQRRIAGLLELNEVWVRVPHRGSVRLRDLNASGVFEQESEGERHAFRTLFAGTWLQADCQVWIAPSIRVDFAVLYAATILEYHGEDAHAGRVDEDATRAHAAERLGYRVVVVTRSMLREPRPLRAFVQRLVTDRGQRIAAGVLPLPPLPPQRGRLTPLRTLYPPSGMLLAA